MGGPRGRPLCLSNGCFTTEAMKKDEQGRKPVRFGLKGESAGRWARPAPGLDL